MPGSLALHQRVQDMETTVTNMHAALKRMQAKAAVAKSKDPLVKANLDMWTLMVDHLDKQLQELKLAEAERQDLEARRAAMYRQADAKADAEARAAQSAQAAKAAEAARSAAGAQAGSPGAQPAGQNAAPAAQPPAPPASTSPSPK
jgi:peptidoglycan hydrolase CwlO-like protein